MKIALNEQQILTLTEIQKKVIQNDIFFEIFEDDMSRRLQYVINQPANRFIEQNAKSAREMLKSKNVALIPSDKMEFAALVLKHAPVELSEVESEKHIVKVDDKYCFEITDVTKKLLKLCVAKEFCCVEWIKQQLQCILTHKYERCMERLRKEWEPKLLSEGLKEFPVDDDAFAELVFKHPEYKNRSQREQSK